MTADDEDEVSAAGYASPMERGGGATAVDASPPPVSAPTIAEQVDEVAREIRQRERVYPKWVEDGRYKPETADKKLRDLRAAHATLSMIAAHAEGLRHLIKTLLRVVRFGSNAERTEDVVTDGEAEMLLQHPAVRAVIEEFPDAEIVSIRRMSP